MAMVEANPPLAGRLDPDAWTSRPGLSRLLDALEAAAGQTRLVGGAVRDLLLRLPVSDIDLATRLTPPDVLARLEAFGIRAVPTGLAHGTITAIVGGQPHEVTTLRRDVTTDGRHAEVAFTDAWEEDAARRDFTVNALFADPLTGEISDFFGGLADLSARRVRFIGDPLRRIAEDHLRILRFFRFSARFATTLDPEGLAACAVRANDLMALSRERIRDELLKLLALPDPTQVVTAMEAHGLFRPVLPEVTAEGSARLAALVTMETRAGALPDGIRRLAALLPPDETVADAVAARLRCSRAERARLVAAASCRPVPADPRAMAYELGADATRDRLLLSGDERAVQWVGPLASWHRPRLPISGKDLIAMGLPPGPQVSRRLAEVEAAWIAAGFPPQEEAARRLARQILGVR